MSGSSGDPNSNGSSTSGSSSSGGSSGGTTPTFDAQPFKIDGVAIPTPTTYGFDVEDLSSENTGRTLDGVMHKDVVAVKDSYPCTWKSLSWTEVAALLNAIDGKSQFNFTHADPRVPNEFITKKFYVGKRSTVAMNLKNNKNTWHDISLTFIRI